MIKLIFNHYWELCLLKESPENTTYSRSLMVLSGILFVLIMVIQWNFSYFDFSDDLLVNFLMAFSLLLSYLVYTYIVLFFRGLPERLVQTLSCLFCTQIIMHILASPLLLFSPYLAHPNLKNPLLLFIGVLYLFFSLGLSVWQFVITAHIYKYALSTSAIQSVLAAFGLIAVNILTLSLWR